jgi:cytochrome d ubiquinol oxidase subunit I
MASPLFLRLAALSWPFGFIAILSGWTVAEVGRQPWLATGILRTADAASPVPAEAVATTLLLFVLVYGIVFAAGILYMNRLINRGPAGEELPVEGVPSRPISAAGGAGGQLFGEEGKGNA